MSYVITPGLQFANKAAMVTQIYANLISAGWSLTDNQDGSSYRVYSSNGESGTRIAEYIKIVTNSSGNLQFYPFYYWNAVTHAGVGAPYTSYQYSQQACNESSTNTLWMMASKDLVFLGIQYGASFSSGFFGHAPVRAWTTIGRLTAPVTSGPNVVLSLDNVTGTFLGGKQYSIVGATGEGRYNVTLTAGGGGTTSITVSSLPANFSTGSLIGVKPSLFCCYPTASAQTSGFVPMTCAFADSGTSTATDVAAITMQTNLYWDSYTQTTSYDHPTGQFYASPIAFQRSGSLSNALNTGLWGSSDSHLLIGPWASFTNADVFSVGSTTSSGTATGTQTNNTLQDTGQAWGVNALAGQSLILSSGTGVGQVRLISSNTSDTITLSQNWVTNPVNTATGYVVAPSAYRVFQSPWSTNIGIFMQEALT